LEGLGEQIGDGIEDGLRAFGNDLTSAASLVAAGISSHGASIEQGSQAFSKATVGLVVEFSRSIHMGLRDLGSTIDRFDATGGVGRHLMGLVTGAQLAGKRLIDLNHYFSRQRGEDQSASYELRIHNASLKPFPGFTFLARVEIAGLGANAVNHLRVSGGVPTQGSFRLSINNNATADIPHDATPVQIQAHLSALAGVGPNQVICSGTRLSEVRGEVNVELLGPLSGNGGPRLVVDRSNLNHGTVQAFRTDEDVAAIRTFSVVVSGDPRRDGVLRIADGTTIALGAFRKSFGIPFVRRIELRQVPSEMRDMANGFLDVLTEADANKPEVLKYASNQRRQAADSLGALGPFAWDARAYLKQIAAGIVPGAQPLHENDLGVRQSALEALRTIESFKPGAVATIILRSGSQELEPASLLTAFGFDPPPARFGAYGGRSASRMPIMAETAQKSLPYGTAGGCDVVLVNDARDRVRSVDMLRLARHIEPNNSAAQSRFRRTVGLSGTNDFNLNTAIEEALRLGNRLQELVLPRNMPANAVNRGIYNVVADIVDPTFDLLRSAVTIYRDLRVAFEQSFGEYTKRGAHDPALTHLVGVQVFSNDASYLEGIYKLSVADAGGVVASEETTFVLQQRNGEVLLPIPLRFVGNDRSVVKVEVSISSNAPPQSDVTLMLTHYCGINDRFSVWNRTSITDAQQQFSHALEFDILRLASAT
jgi:hypothetical protein